MGFAVGKFLGAVAGLAGFLPGGQGFAAAAAAGAKLFPGDPLLRYFSPESTPGRRREDFPFGWQAWPAALTPRPDPVCWRMNYASLATSTHPLTKLRIGAYGYAQQALSVQVEAEVSGVPKKFYRAPSPVTQGIKSVVRSPAIVALDSKALHKFTAQERELSWDVKLFGGDAKHPQRVKTHVGAEGLIPKEEILYRMCDVAAGLELQRQGLDPAWALAQFSPVSKRFDGTKTYVYSRNSAGQLVFTTPDPVSVRPIVRPGAPSVWDGWNSVSLTGKPVQDAWQELEQITPILRNAWEAAMIRFQDAIEVEEDLQDQVAQLVNEVRSGRITPDDLRAALNNEQPAATTPARGVERQLDSSSSAASSIAGGSFAAPSPALLAIVAGAALLILARGK